MPELWMPGAARHSLGNTGAMDGGPARAVWHITSNEHDWTFTNELGWFTGGGADVAPHLLWDPFTGEIAQFFPADSRSLSLQNAGSVRTNRTGKYCIQIETVFTAGETVGGRTYATVRDTPCKGLSGIVAWLRSLGIADGWPGGAPVAFARDTVSIDTWMGSGGHYGHNQVPGNSHVDPGPMPSLFTTIPNEEDDVPLTDAEISKIAKASAKENWAYLLDSPTAAEGTNPARTAGTFLRYGDAKYAATTAQIGALQGAVTALSAVVGSAGGITAAQVEAAAKAGADAALAELGEALTKEH
ncbi:hypothetical protein STRTUCAR8_08541 [Streptomyces turgidiscabies Car8]|uniref:Uncharacterized protein n=1 Tax=Streptomyces turgidiscabies (strain Car8) TaxID=698760 RepID=L7FAM3_STRT8|nr:hypothetical protein [Streptomyces turgidiscabies]ELP67715.1 hypothetical protein STRTUCAR8_08541 [Streptomyces turgidiscabies Car8]